MTRVLVPVGILKGETISAGLIDLLGTVDVTILGYHELPEQTPADQARAQFEDRAISALGDLEEEFRTAGGAADHRLVFTHDREKSRDRVAEEVGADAFAISGATGVVDRLLVPLAGGVAADKITEFVVDLVGDRDIGVTLLLAGGPDVDRTDLDEATDRLTEAGIDVTAEQVEKKPFEALVEAVPGHDAIVMGERAPSLGSLLFGEESNRVAAISVGPVLVVRNPDPDPSILG